MLGDIIEDPYAIENVQKALVSLKSASVTDVSDYSIEANHKYVRFLPKDEMEWDLLKKDTVFQLFDYPLHYELEEGGLYYHDPSLPKDVITWQYCVVPIDKELPNVHSELIYNVYIPSDDDDLALKSASKDDDIVNKLLYESYRLTGNLTEKDASSQQTRGWFKPKRWTPSGRITVKDDILGTIPLHGAKVCARWATHVKTDITDANGRFSMGHFIYRVNYCIKWERYDYSIRNNKVGQALFNGPKQKGAWNPYIDGGKSKYYAHIHRAAHHYYYKDIQNIRRPPGNSFWKAQVKIAACEDGNTSGGTDPDKRYLGIGNMITMNCASAESDFVYSTTIHELGHASHWAAIGDDLIDVPLEMLEAWASGVEYALAKMVYPSFTLWGKRNKRIIMPPHSFYCHLVECLISPVGDGDYFDQVEGYTIKQIEDALVASRTWDEWKQKLKDNYENATENELDRLFDYSLEWALPRD